MSSPTDCTAEAATVCARAQQLTAEFNEHFQRLAHHVQKGCLPHPVFAGFVFHHLARLEFTLQLTVTALEKLGANVAAMQGEDSHGG